MSRHLSSREVSQWMIGERTPQQEQHVRQCSQCGAELTRLEASLALFRGSVRNWSDGQSRAEPPAMGSILPVRRGSWAQPLRWALVAAALLVLAAVPIYRNVQDRQRQAEIARADALLLEQVDAEVSRAVPRPMEPLAKLVSCDFNHNPASSTFYMDQTKVLDGTLVSILSWYDNEWGYSCRVADLAAYMIQKGL